MNVLNEQEELKFALEVQREYNYPFLSDSEKNYVIEKSEKIIIFNATKQLVEKNPDIEGFPDEEIFDEAKDIIVKYMIEMMAKFNFIDIL